MEYNIGIEMRDEYKSFEAALGAMKLVRDIMLVKPGENVVITYDSSTDRRVAEAAANAAHIIGAVPTLICYPTSKHSYGDPPPPVGAAVGKADVWIEFAYVSVMHSPAYRQAVDVNGARYICLLGMDVEMLVNTISNVDVDTVVEFGEFLKARFERAKDILITSREGTNLRGNLGGRIVRHSGQKATKKGYPVMLGGQISFCPLEETIEGTLVFDGAIFPPASLGILKNKVVLELKKGRVTDFSGEGDDWLIFKRWIESFRDENMYLLAHYSLGFNPGVTKPTGRIVEDERVFGCMEFGIGSQGVAIGGRHWSAASHTDGTVLRPTIVLDGDIFEEDGIYKDEEAAGFCGRLGAAGY